MKEFKKSLTNKPRNHLGQLLLKTHKLFIEESINHLAKLGHSELLPHHFYTIVHIDYNNGCEVSEIIKNSGDSKQVISNTLRHLEDLGYIKKVKSQLDARAKKVYFTKKGLSLIKDGLKVVDTIESKYSLILGVKNFKTLKKSLLKISSEL